MTSAETKKQIERVIREGVDREYLDIVNDLKDIYYLEDIAAAAIKLYAGQGPPQGVRRRTLHNVTFVPLRTAEEKVAVEKKKPAQHVPKPGTVRKSVHGEQKGRRGPR
jgi:hypothetical protein